MTTGASTQILLDDYDCDYYNALIFIPIVLIFLLINIPHLTIVGFKLRQAGLLLRLLDTNPATLLLFYHSNLLLVKCRQILTNTWLESKSLFHLYLQDGYKNSCSLSYPLHCEVGDLNSKQGPISLGMRYLKTDVSLPLTGDFTGKFVWICVSQTFRF